MIGHNNPPSPISLAAEAAIAPLGDELSEARNWADGSPVENDEQMNMVDGFLAVIRQAESALKPIKAEFIEPLHAAHKAALADLSVYTNSLGQLKSALVASVDVYKRAKAAEVAAKGAALKAEADARAEAARQAHQSARGIDEIEEAEAAIKAAKEAAIAAKKAEAERPKGLRRDVVPMVDDPIAFGRWLWANQRQCYIEFLEGAARKFASARPDGVVMQERERAV